MMLVILDTNILVAAGEGLVDIDRELQRLMNKYQVGIAQACMDELSEAAQMRNAKGVAAQTALRIIQTAGWQVIAHEPGHADDVIIALARDNQQCAVATQDKALKKEIRKLKKPIIALRSKSHLIMT